MKLTVTEHLETAQRTKIEALVHTCRSHDSSNLSFPFEEAGLYLLFEEKERTAAVMAFTHTGAQDYVCSAFTHPRFRRQGLFSGLLAEGLKRLPEDADILFYTDGSCAAALAALDSLGAEYLGSECLLELPAEAAVKQIDPDIPLSVSRVPGPDEPMLLYETAYGRLFISFRPDTCFLSGFEIREGLRGLGHGKELLSAVLADLRRRNAGPVRLEVSGDNMPALALYQKAGFRTIETLRCYLY